MAKINTNTRESIYRINKWHGLNENPDGDISLKMGEAAEMRNFKITNDGHLQKRPGVNTVINFESKVDALWNGNVNGVEVTIAAAGGVLWLIDLENQTKTQIGTCGSESVSLFGYSQNVYMLDGLNYKKWTGSGEFTDVEGYRPIISVSTPPEGGGTLLEPVNKLNALRCAQFSPDGSATTFTLPETNISAVDYVKDLTTGTDLTGWTTNAAEGTVTLAAAPVKGVNTIEIGYTASQSYRSEITAMRYAETYNGTTDNRVFLYGDGTNKAIYSDIDRNGEPSAEYFPDLNVLHAGESNTPITGMIRQFSRLIVYKTDSTWSVAYSELTLADGTVTAGFYVTPVNRIIGNEAPGQICLITNYPRSLHGGGVYEWKNGSYGLTSDERQAKRISRRIEATLSSFDLTRCRVFDDEFRQEYYVCYNDKAVIHNYATDAWYLYTEFPAYSFVVVDNQLYIGTTDGRLCHVSREYMSDDGAEINAYWKSGSMDFGQEWRRKFSTMIFVTIKPESAARVTVTAMSDRKAQHMERVIAANLATFGKVNFSRFSFNTNRRSQVERAKIKVKGFALYQLVFKSNSANERSTIESVDFRLRYTGYVK